MHFNVYTLTIEQLRPLIASGDDSHQNQVRITASGEIFLSSIVGRFETFDTGNGYVGARAAADQKFIERLFAAI